MTDLLTRDQAGRILGLTREGVRKLERKELTPVKQGRIVYFHRGEVEAVKSARGARVPLPTKAEREVEREAQRAARDEGAQLREAERERKAAEAAELARAKAYVSRNAASDLEWESGRAARKAKEDALRALAGAFVARTVDAMGAAAILGETVTRREVEALMRKGVLPQAAHAREDVERWGGELESAVSTVTPSFGPRFDRDEVWRVRRDMRTALGEEIASDPRIPSRVREAAKIEPDALTDLFASFFAKLTRQSTD